MWRAAPAALPCLLAAKEMQHYLWPITHSVSITADAAGGNKPTSTPSSKVLLLWQPQVMTAVLGTAASGCLQTSRQQLTRETQVEGYIQAPHIHPQL